MIEGFFFSSKLALDVLRIYSTGPRLPRAGGLAIWPGTPGAKKNAVLDLPTL